MKSLLLHLSSITMGKTTLLKRFVVEILDYAHEGTEGSQSMTGGFVPLLMPVVTLAGILGSAASATNADVGEVGSQALARRTSAQAVGEDVRNGVLYTLEAPLGLSPKSASRPLWSNAMWHCFVVAIWHMHLSI